jgi:lysophospholipase L1-like esterase
VPWRRLAQLLLAVLIYLVVIEGGLQIAAFFMKRTTGGGLPTSWVTGNQRVLCLGDSNTYGLWLHRHEAYPQQLEAIWNRRIETPKVEVMNLGFPGTNSSRLLRNLPDLLETLAPDIVIIMVGANDFWTVPQPPEDAEGTPRRKNFIQAHSILYKLYHMLRRSRNASRLEIQLDPNEDHHGGDFKARFGDREFEMGYVRADPGLESDYHSLEVNLRRLVERAREGGGRLYLMTYPSRAEFYGVASGAIAEAAADTGTPLIDLAAVFDPFCPKEPCPDILFPDHHPKARGYRLVAETLLFHLSEPPSP